MIEERDALMYEARKYGFILAVILLVIILPFSTFYIIASNNIATHNNEQQNNHPIIINTNTNTNINNNGNGNSNDYIMSGSNGDIKVVVHKPIPSATIQHIIIPTVTVRPTLISTSKPVLRPTITVVPAYTVPVNNENLDQFDFIKCDGLNTNYTLNKLSFTHHSTVKLNVNITNLEPDIISTLGANINVASYVWDSVNNEPSIDQSGGSTYSVGNLKLKQYDDFIISDTYTMPDTPGKYMLICNINANNGANLHIQEIITIT